MLPLMLVRNSGTPPRDNAFSWHHYKRMVVLTFLLRSRPAFSVHYTSSMNLAWIVYNFPTPTVTNREPPATVE